MKKKLSIIVLVVIAIVVVAIPFSTKAQNANVSVISRVCKEYEYRTNEYIFIEPVYGGELVGGVYQNGHTDWDATFKHDSDTSTGWEIVPTSCNTNHGKSESSGGCLYYQIYNNNQIGKDDIGYLTEIWVEMVVNSEFESSDFAYTKIPGRTNTNPNTPDYYYFKHSSSKSGQYTDDDVVRTLRGADASKSYQVFKTDMEKSVFSLENGTHLSSAGRILNSSGGLENQVTFKLYKDFPTFSLNSGSPFNTNLYSYYTDENTRDSNLATAAKRSASCSQSVTYNEESGSHTQHTLDPYTYCEAYAVVIYEVPLRRCVSYSDDSSSSPSTNTYTITYDKNTTDDVSDMPQFTTIRYVYDAVAIIDEAIPKRNGYTFLGWSTNKNATSPDCEYTYTAANSICSESGRRLYNSDKSNKDLYLWAIWQNNSTGRVETPEDNNVQNSRTGVGIAYTLIGTILVCSTGAILYIRKKNKFSDI